MNHTSGPPPQAPGGQPMSFRMSGFGSAQAYAYNPEVASRAMSLTLVGDGGATFTETFSSNRRRLTMGSPLTSSRGKRPEKSTSPSERASDTMRLARRKACDLCFNKKIKCDMLKPVCSNCILYHAECRTTIIRRKAPTTKDPRQSSSSPGRATSPTQIEPREALESRLARIESQLQQVLILDAAAADRLGTTNSASPGQHASSLTPSEHHRNLLELGPAAQPNAWTITPTQQGLYEQLPQDHLTIPPLDEIAPVVDHFFNVFNTVTPLFCRNTFMGMLSEFYSDPSSRNKATWAAIQIVIAIGYRTPFSDGMPMGSERAHRANTHLQSAQSVMSHLVTREDDLLGLQVLLGIVILFLNSSDYKPAAVISGNASRLVYQLGLHEAESDKHGSPEEAEQRAHLFWIAYRLDRGLSLRTKTPPGILDEDIDIPLPSAEPQDGVGLIWIPGSDSHINFLRTETDLAYIEGKIFDLLHSPRASKIRGSERELRIQHLKELLERWYNRIPPLFQVDHLVSTLSPCGVVRMTRLFHMYEMAVLSLHGVYNTQDAQWVEQLGTATPIDVDDFTTRFQELVAPCRRNYPAPSLSGWEQCVSVSRACMKLFQNAFPNENVVWHCVCPLYCGTLVLYANILFYPNHPLATLDQYMCNKAIALLEQVEHAFTHFDLTARGVALQALVRKANAVVEGGREGRRAEAVSGEARVSRTQQTLVGSLHGALDSARPAQGFSLSLISAQDSMYDNALRQVEFGTGVAGFSQEDMEAFGVPPTGAMADMHGYPRYSGGQ